MTTIIALVWFTAAFAQLVLAGVCLRGSLHKRFPSFAAFVYFQNAICIFAACVYNSAPGAYFWAYHASFGLTAALILLVAVECGKHTFGPRIALPKWVPARIATMIATAIALATALDLLFAATNGGRLLRAMVTTEQGLTVMALAVFLVIISYSQRLGISGNQRTHKIMAGFVLYLSINVMAVFIRGQAWPKGAAVIASGIGMAAYCVSLVYWTVALWRQEPAPERLTVEQTNELTAALSRLRERASGMGITATR